MYERATRLASIVAVSAFIVGMSSHGSRSVVTAQVVAAPRNAVTTGEFLIEPPTLINLGFEWFIQGDDNRNAAVEVSYRKQGETGWSSALPLLRLHRERIFVGTQFDVVAPNMFAGSVLDLEPDTDYEARFVMTDPDGVIGEASKTVTVRTRAEPVPYEEGRVFHVYPRGFEGTKLEPSFEGLMCAYNSSCGGGDFATAGRPRVRPGDIVLVHAGLYRNNRYQYGGANRTFPFEGTYRLTADGTPERPIAIKPPVTAKSSSTATATSRSSTSWLPTTPISRASRFATRSSPFGPASSSSRGRRGSPSSTPVSRMWGPVSSPIIRVRATSTSPTTGSTAATTQRA